MFIFHIYLFVVYFLMNLLFQFMVFIKVFERRYSNQTKLNHQQKQEQTRAEKKSKKTHLPFQQDLLYCSCRPSSAFPMARNSFSTAGRCCLLRPSSVLHGPLGTQLAHRSTVEPLQHNRTSWCLKEVEFHETKNQGPLSKAPI